MNPKEYEKALSEKLLYQFPSPIFEIIHDLKVKGRFSKGNRQIDVAVRRRGENHPFLAAEAKKHARKVNIGYIDAFIMKLKDVGAEIGIMVAPSDYSIPGRRLAMHFRIELRVMTIDEALETQWYAVARRIFPSDWAHHPQIGAGLHRLNKSDEPQNILDSIEDVPFEEWESFVKYALKKFPSEAIEFLRFIAAHHYDSGWRYNAFQQLIEIGELTQFDVTDLISQETDSEIIELLRESGFE